MNSWTLSLLNPTPEDSEEISLFLLLRNIETVLDYILTSMESLRNNQFFSESAITQIKQLHQALWRDKYQVSEIEYTLIIMLMDKKAISLADLTTFLKEKGLSTTLIAGWMNSFIRKLHQNGDFFIETRPHPSGTEYYWSPTMEIPHG